MKRLFREFLRHRTVSLIAGSWFFAFCSLIAVGSARADFIISNGATVTVTNSAVLDSSGSIIISSGCVLDASAVVNGGGQIRLSGNWNNLSTMTAFVSAGSTVTFYDTGASSITGNTSFYYLQCTDAGKTIYFQNGSTQTVSTMTITGTLGNEILLKPTLAGTTWYINPIYPSTITFVNVTNSNAMAQTVTAVNSIDSGGNNARWLFRSSNNSPNPPTGLTMYTGNFVPLSSGSWVNNYQQIRATFSITDPDGGDTVKFNIQFTTYSDFSTLVVNSTSPSGGAPYLSQGATNFLTPLLAEGTWYWRVMTIDNSGAGSGFSSMTAVNGFHFGVDVTSPTEQGISSITSWISSVTVNVKTASDVISGLHATPNSVRFSTGASFVTALTTAAEWFNGPSTITWTGLTPNTTYFFQARARDVALNVSSWTAGTLTVSTQATLANYPASLTWNAINVTSMTINWGASSPDNPSSTTYIVQLSSTNFNGSGTIYSSTTLRQIGSAIITGLDPDTTYYGQVAAKNWIGIGSTATMSPSSQPTLASFPASLAWSSAYVSSLTVNWGASSPDNPSTCTYVVQLSSTNFNGSGTLYSSTTVRQIGSAIITGLSANTTYYGQVAAQNWAGTGATTTITSPSTKVTSAAVPSPTAFSATDVWSTSITFNWGANGNPPNTFYEANVSSISDFSIISTSQTNTTTSITTTTLAQRTTYYFRLRAKSNEQAYTDWSTTLSTQTKWTHGQISIDGSASDWQSLPSLSTNSSTISNGEWIWKDKGGEERIDGTNPDTDYDLTEVHVFADNTDIYWLFKLDDITAVDRTYIGISIQTGTVSGSMAQSGVTWGPGDDSSMNQGSEYGSQIKVTRQVVIHASTTLKMAVEYYDGEGGTNWYGPPSSYQSSGTAAGNFVEVKMNRTDLALAGAKSFRFTLATFENTSPPQSATGAQGTVVYNPNALDAMSILRISTGLLANQYTSDQNHTVGAWAEDISDSDIDFWAQIQLDKDGIVNDVPPTGPTLSAPISGVSTNTLTPTLSWTAATDSDQGDAVTSYLIEIATGTDLDAFVTYRLNVSGSTTSWNVPAALLRQKTYNWRVRARDRSGALSTVANETFVTQGPPDTPSNPWAEVAGSSISVSTSVSASTITFHFTQTDDAGDTDRYTVQLSTMSSFDPLWISSTSALIAQGATYFAVINLINGASYWWRVWSMDNNGTGGSTATIGSAGNPAFMVDRSSPGAVSDLNAAKHVTASTPSISLSWSPVTDLYSGTTGYNIYRAAGNTTITNINRSSYRLYVGTNTISAFTDVTTSTNTQYTYAVCAVDAAGNEADVSNSSTVVTAKRLIDGIAGDWTGTAGTIDNSATMSGEEWIWRDKSTDERQDGGVTNNRDLREIRMTADDTYVYIYARYNAVTNVDKINLAVSVDTDTVTSAGMNWIADESGSTIGNEYPATQTAAPFTGYQAYGEKNIEIGNDNLGVSYPYLFKLGDSGNSWYLPVAGWGSSITVNGNFLETRIPRSSLGLSGGSTATLTFASYENATFSNGPNGGDMTAQIGAGTQDAVDSVSIVRMSTGSGPAQYHNDINYNVTDGAEYRNGVNTAWAEDINDGDIDFWVRLYIASSGTITNTVPTAPSGPSPANAVTISSAQPVLSWAASTDSDDGDAVTSYLIEFASNPINTDNKTDMMMYRVNVSTPRWQIPSPLDSVAFNWRVFARDRRGALSGVLNTTFTVNAPPLISAAYVDVNGSSQPFNTWVSTMNGSVRINFTITESSATQQVSFRLQVSTASDFNTGAMLLPYGTNYVSALFNAGATNYILTSVAAGASYYWQVSAVNSSGGQSSTMTANGGGYGFKIDSSSPTSITPTGTTGATGNNSIDLSWTAAADTYSGVLGYRIYRSSVAAISNTNRGVAPYSQIASSVQVTASSTTYSDTDAALQANTTYYYAACAVDYAGNLADVGQSTWAMTPAILIDGTTTDWTGTAGTIDNSATISNGEWIWRDKTGEQRTDTDYGTPNTDFDINEFRVKADASSIYFYFKMANMSSKDRPHFSISIDTDNSAGTGLNWIGADTKQAGQSIGLGAEYGNMSGTYHAAEKNIEIFDETSGVTRIWVWSSTSSIWFRGDGLNSPVQSYLNTTNKTLEAAVSRSFFGWTGAQTFRVSVAVSSNVPGNPNSIDTTGSIGTSLVDPGDAMSIVRISTGSSANQYVNDWGNATSAWAEDLNDGDVDFWTQIPVTASGIGTDTPPTTPTLLNLLNGQTTTQTQPIMDWTDSSDSDSGDAVTSYLLEVSTNPTFSDNADLASGGYRVNVIFSSWQIPSPLPDFSTYYYRVFARDRVGELSAATSISSFTVMSDSIAPSAITNLVASSVNVNSSDGYRSITLQWTAPGDDNLTGNLTGQFEIRWSTSNPIANETDWNATSTTFRIILTTNSEGVAAWTPRQTVTKVMTGLTSGLTYYFGIKAADDAIGPDGKRANWTALDTTATRPQTRAPGTFHDIVADSSLTDWDATTEKVGSDTRNGGTTDLYITWNSTEIAIAWSGRDWSVTGTGDFMIYFDTDPAGSGGTTGAVGTFGGLWDTSDHTLPFKADAVFATEVGTNGYWEIRTSSGQNTWGNLPYKSNGLNGNIRTSFGNPTAEVIIPLTDLANPAPTRMRIMAHAKNDTTKAVFASYPTQNPAGNSGTEAFTYYYDFYLTSGVFPVELPIRSSIVPGSISDLTALSGPADGDIQLNWTTPGNDGTTGNIIGATYTLNYATTAITSSNFTTVPLGVSMSIATDTVVGQKVGKLMTGLNPGTTYYFALKLTDDVGLQSTWSNVGVNILSSAPATDLALSAPTGIAATGGNVTTNTITVTWTQPSAPANVDDRYQYKLYAATASFTSSSDTWVKMSSSVLHPLSQATTASIIPNTTYFFRVSAVDSGTITAGLFSNAIESSLSSQISTATLAVTPTTVAFTAADVWASSITFNWLASSNPTGTFYEANIATSSDFTLFSTSQTSSAVSITTASLAGGTSYFFRVRARNYQNIYTSWSGTISTVTTPSFILNSSFEDGNGTDAAGWIEGTNHVRSNDNAHTGSWSLKSTYSGSGTDTHITVPVSSNTTYTLSAWIYNQATSGGIYVDMNDIADELTLASTVNNQWQNLTGNWFSGSRSSVTIRCVTDGSPNGTAWFDDVELRVANPPDLTPNAPLSVVTTSTGSGSAMISWAQPSDNDIQNIRLYRSTSPSTIGYSLLTSLSASTTWYSDQGLDPDKTYTYIVRSTDTTQESAAVEFDGVTSSVTLPSALTLNTTDMTLALWIKPNQLRIQGVVSKSYATWRLFMDNTSGNMEFDSTSDLYNAVSGNTVAIGTWTHVACTYSSSAQQMKLYLNGTLEATVNSATDIGAWQNVAMTISPLEVNKFDGAIDEVYYYARALNSSEVNNVMNDVAPSTGLVSIWKMNESSTFTVADGNANNNGTLYGGIRTVGKKGKPVSLTPDITQPGSISDLTALSGTLDGEVNLKWTAPGSDGNSRNITNGSYTLKYASSSISSSNFATVPYGSTVTFSTTTVPGQAVGRTVTGLNPGTTYYFALKVTDNAGLQASWSNAGINILSSAPATDLALSAPTGVAATGGNVTTNTITVSFTQPAAPANVDDRYQYKLYAATASFTAASDSWVKMSSSVLHPLSQATTASIIPNTTYFFRVSAVDSGTITAGLFSNAIESSLSSQISTATLAAAPSGQIFTPSDVWATSITFNWLASSNPTGTNYEVNVATSSDFVLYSTSQTTLGVSMTTTTLTTQATYYFRVRAINWQSIPTAWSFTLSTITRLTDSTPPSAVTSLSALIGDSSGTIKLSWVSPGDDALTGNLSPGTFRIFYSSVASDVDGLSATTAGTATRTRMDISTTGVAPYTLRDTVLTGLTEAVTYYFRIFTGDEVPNWSAISNSATAQAQVTIISVSVSGNSFNFGSVKLSQTTNTVTAMVVTNNGNAIISYQLKATTVTAGTTWAVGNDTNVAPGNDIFLLRGAFHNVQPSTSPTVAFGAEDVVSTNSFTCTSTRYSIDGTETGVSVPVNAARDLWWFLNMPLTSSVVTQQQINVIITGVLP